MNWNFYENICINTSFGLLLLNLIIYWSGLAFPKLKNIEKLGKISTSVVNLLLFITLLGRWITSKYFPLSNLYESLIFLSWCLSFSHIIIENKYKNIVIGAISTPISLFTIAFASLCLPGKMQEAAPLVPALRSNWLMMHVTIMMTSYAALMLGSLLSILFLIVNARHEIHVKQNTVDNFISANKIRLYNENNLIIERSASTTKLTLLNSIDNLSYRIIGLGFPLLTIGIIAGSVWANEAWGSYWSWDPKETWALITWLTFAAYLHSRLNKAWRGKKPAVLASIGFFTVWICYLGVNFLGKGLHSYGWL